jgi:hypothetical protein
VLWRAGLPIAPGPIDDERPGHAGLRSQRKRDGNAGATSCWARIDASPVRLRG